MTGLWQDVRYALRKLARGPAFTVSALATLAVGIGATIAIFTVTDHVLLRPLPYPEADRLVRVHPAAPARGVDRAGFSVSDFRDWAAGTESLDSMGLYSTIPGDLVMTGGDEPFEVETAYVAGDFFRTLGVRALHGRTLAPEDETRNSRVVVLAHDLWQQRFGGDRDLVGATVDVEGTPFEIVGIMPPDFGFPFREVGAWALLEVIPASSIPLHIRGVRFLDAVGRLAAETTMEEASEELGAIASSLAAEHPESNEGLVAATLLPLREVEVGEAARSILALQVAVGIVLLLACANVAALLLARGTERRRELAVRSALGASRTRVIRQLLVESLVLGLAGGLLGLGVAAGSLRLLLIRGAELLPRAHEVAIDGRVLAAALGISLVAAALFGVLPALRLTSRVDASDLARRGTADRGTGRGGWSRRWLIVFETAIAILLLVSAGLLLRTLGELQRVDPGFEPEGLVALELTVSDERYPERKEYLEVHRQIVERLADLPGTEGIGTIRHFPLRGTPESFSWSVPGEPPPPPGSESLRLVQVSPELLPTLGTPLLRGRDVLPTDREGSPLVVVVNESLATRAFGARDPVGERLRIADLEAEVVGVVGNLRHTSLREPPEAVAYIPQEQLPRRGFAIVLRASSEDPRALVPRAESVIRSVAPEQPVTAAIVGEESLADEIATFRFLCLLLGCFASVALFLTCVGIYGVVAHQVRQERASWGIRLALGATPARVVRQVVAGTLGPAAFGIVIGGLGALAAGRLLESLLFRVGPLDEVAFSATVGLILAVTLVASALPARAAASLDPGEVLREE